jgi:alpha-beta hydrolase superfamily lysophospholipase
MEKTEPPRSSFTVESDGLAIAGEVTETPCARSLVVLVHGIPLSVPNPSDGGYPLLASKIAERGHATLTFNMRGTGASEGDFHIGGWYRDIETVMDFVGTSLRDRFEKVFMVGFSAGGALSIEFVARHGGVDGLAACAAPARFTTLFPREELFVFLEVAKEVGIIRRFDFPPSPDGFYKELEDNAAIDYVGRVNPVPLLLIHGDADTMVPVSDAHQLAEAAGEPKELVVLPAGEHQLRHDERTLDTIFGWLVSLRA